LQFLNTERAVRTKDNTLDRRGIYPIVGDDSGRLSHPRILPEARRHAPELRLADSEIAALLWAGRQAGAKWPFRDALFVGKGEAASHGICKGRSEGRGIDVAMIDGCYSYVAGFQSRETVLVLMPTCAAISARVLPAARMSAILCRFAIIRGRPPTRP
jgi:hypothetical protein